jgi:mevalonate kinase
MGFGSSAALCVAAVMAGLSFLSGRLRYPFRRSAWKLSNRAERLFHGTPSGIDTGLSVLGGMHVFYPAPPRLPRARSLDGFPLFLVVGAVPRQRDTRALVADIGRRIRSGEVHVVKALARLGRLSVLAVRLLTDKNPEGVFELARLANEAQQILRDLGLSSDELDELIESGLDAGAEGGKLSGAGGGGAFFLLARSEEKASLVAQRVRSRARDLGLPTVDTIVPVAWLGGQARDLQTSGSGASH